MGFIAALLLLCAAACAPAVRAQLANSTFHNPILPGFHPDPSCIFVPEWDETFFCASSSFNAFPGIPIHASKDLQSWKLIGHVLNRREQLPRLAETNRSTRCAQDLPAKYGSRAADIECEAGSGRLLCGSTITLSGW